MNLRTKRWYAFAVLLLRDLFRAASNDALFEWKARTVLCLSEVWIGMTIIMLTCMAAGWHAFLRSFNAFFGSALIIGALLIWANREVERRLLPRYEREFRRLSKRQRVAATSGLVLLMVLSLVAFVSSAGLVRARVAGIHSNPTSGQRAANR